MHTTSGAVAHNDASDIEPRVVHSLVGYASVEELDDAYDPKH